MFNSKKKELKIQGNWIDISEKLKLKYPQLHDEDLVFKIGKEDVLLQKVGYKINKNREEVINIISGLDHKL